MRTYEENIQNHMSFNLPDLWCWSKSKDYLYTGHNSYFAQFFGFENSNEMLGLTDYDLRSEAVKLAKVFQAGDQLVISHNSPMKFLEILKSATKETRIVLTSKAPLFDKNDHVIGTIGYAAHITKHFFKLGCLLARPYSGNTVRLTENSFIIGDKNSGEIKLTSRQSECLFFLLHFKTAKQIALILEISFRTVEEHVEKLKLNFNCKSKVELLEKAIDLGFLNVIPPSLFNTQLSVILD